MPTVRCSVARHPNTPHRTLELLKQDENFDVRQAAWTTLRYAVKQTLRTNSETNGQWCYMPVEELNAKQIVHALIVLSTTATARQVESALALLPTWFGSINELFETVENLHKPKVCVCLCKLSTTAPTTSHLTQQSRTQSCVDDTLPTHKTSTRNG